MDFRFKNFLLLRKFITQGSIRVVKKNLFSFLGFGIKSAGVLVIKIRCYPLLF